MQEKQNMSKFREQENVAELAFRLIAKLKATQTKKNCSDGFAEYGPSETSAGNSGINPTRHTQKSSA